MANMVSAALWFGLKSGHGSRTGSVLRETSPLFLCSALNGKELVQKSFIIYIHFLERCNIPCLRYAYDRFEPVSERFLLKGEKKKAVGMLSFAIVLWMLIVGIDVQLTPHLDDT